MHKLSGAVERITFHNSDNGYTALRLRPEVHGRQRLPSLSSDLLITVVGNLPEVSPSSLSERQEFCRTKYSNIAKKGKKSAKQDRLCGNRREISFCLNQSLRLVKLMHTFEIESQANQIPFSVGSQQTAQRKLPEPQHFFYDADNGFYCTFA